MTHALQDISLKGVSRRQQGHLLAVILWWLCVWATCWWVLDLWDLTTKGWRCLAHQDGISPAKMLTLSLVAAGVVALFAFVLGWQLYYGWGWAGILFLISLGIFYLWLSCIRSFR
jgi:hypothetical protein